MKTVLTAEQIAKGVAQLAEEITGVYGDRPLTIIGVMTGSVVLMADLIRQLRMPLRVGVVQASSYRDDTTRGKLIVNSEMLLDIKDRDVILIDDIYDTGHTLVEVMALMQQMHPASLKAAVLLWKEGRQEVNREPDFAAFKIPNEFVVGYGLDYQDEYRNLPYLAALEDEDLR